MIENEEFMEIVHRGNLIARHKNLMSKIQERKYSERLYKLYRNTIASFITFLILYLFIF